MSVLPPGTLLQLLYLRERLKSLAPGRFIEIGPGSGEITDTLLKAGWTGTVYELSDETIASLRQRFADELRDGRLKVRAENYLNSSPADSEHGRVNLIISCMVMEHLDSDAEQRFMTHSANQIRDDGRMIGFVPASPTHWGIEDEIAGHFRRYDRGKLDGLFRRTNWKPLHVAGLTYPVSNLLLPVSNCLVRRHEENKLSLPMLERTKHSGRRNVRFKTHFPSMLKILLNEVTMLPLHWLQKLCSKSDRALVIYFEAEKKI